MKTIRISALVIAMLSLSFVQAQDKEMKKIEKRFAKMDANSDGSLSQDEVDSFFKDKTNKAGDAFNTKKMFKKWDKNEDGVVNLKEYVAHMNRKK